MTPQVRKFLKEAELCADGAIAAAAAKLLEEEGGEFCVLSIDREDMAETLHLFNFSDGDMEKVAEELNELVTRHLKTDLRVAAKTAGVL